MGEIYVAKTLRFTTTANLREQLQALGAGSPGAIFHAAAVSDFAFGKISVHPDGGESTEIKKS